MSKYSTLPHTMSCVLIATFGLGVTAAHADSDDELSVAMTTWTGYGLIHLADQKGFFEDNGVSVDVRTMQDKAATASAMATGRLDGWATTVDTFVFYDAERVGAKQVLAVDFSRGGEGIIADESVESTEDLTGKTVAADEGSSTFFFMLNVLADAGLTLDDIDHQTMAAGDAGSAFMAGRVDAAATWDPWLSRAAERDDARVLIDTAERPGLIVDTVAFRDQVIEDRPDDVQAFVAGYFDAYDYWQENTDEANEVMADSLGIEMENFVSGLEGLVYVSRDQNAEYFGLSDDGDGIVETIEQGGRVYRDAGVIDRAPKASEVVDTSFLEAYLDDR